MRGAAQNQVADAETIACVENASTVALRDGPNQAIAIAVLAANDRCRSHWPVRNPCLMSSIEMPHFEFRDGFWT
jgi:hypothetical protein